MLEGGIRESDRSGVSAAGRYGGMHALLELAVELLQARDLRDALTATIRSVARSLAADRVLVLGYVPAPPALRILAAASPPAQEVSISGPLSLPVPAGGGAVPYPESWHPGVHAASWLSQPLSAGDTPFGLLCVLSEHAGNFSDGDEAFLHEAANLLNAALRRLQAAVRHRSQLDELHRISLAQTLHILGNCVRHELTQPVTAALGYLFCCRPELQEDAPDTARIVKLQEKAAAEIRRLNEQVAGLRETLEYRDADPVAVNVNGLIDIVLDLLRGEVERLGISVCFTPAPRLPAVRLDHSMGLLLFYNLLRACMEAVERAVRGNITLSTALAPSGDVEVGFAHSGSPFHQDLLNNPCVSGSFRNMQDGKLALAACRYIIDNHHGGFRLAALPGGGSGLYISLPAYERGEAVDRKRQRHLHCG